MKKNEIKISCWDCSRPATTVGLDSEDSDFFTPLCTLHFNALPELHPHIFFVSVSEWKTLANVTPA